MGDVKLSTGKVVPLDLSHIKWGEWRKYFSSRGTPKEDDAFIEKVTGMKSDEQNDLLRDDMRRIIQAVIKEGQPLADLNLAKESISD